MRNRRQAIKVRVLLWASVPLALFALWGGWEIFISHGLRPADGGVLRPLWERAAFGGFVAALGLAAGAGMAIFAARYVTAIRRDGDVVDIDVISLYSTRTIRVARADIAAGRYYRGRMVTGMAPSVNAPWKTLRIRGRRIPFVIDLQAEQIDLERL